ncbi:nucleotidyltransferase-like protein [Paenibacillus protaetiae]|uniref:Nucleotidyltransferase-like domain-containing protein n=1 Tax=Paenibacillus protaetiae TaxID=2509456 RepID=A0A4V0YF84_9BACL|nr:nucleotidyltransferase-like protein [Paenibacillus protaetiae]QAY66821.1 hypothetical protein ET464_10875 [Paenibacillus protaetiae]
MEQTRDYLISRFKAYPVCIGLVFWEHPKSQSTTAINGFDSILLVIKEDNDSALATELVMINGKRILIRSVVWASIQHQLLTGENRDFIQWLVQGEIWLDAEGFIHNAQKQLTINADCLKERRLLSRFSGFLSEYLLAKHHLGEHHILDAHAHVVHALHHWAHLILIEEGLTADDALWVQLRRVHPGIYKLYEELTASPESLQLRVELVMLACEFSVMNKMKSCCALLLDILASKNEPWSLQELYAHEALLHIDADLPLILQKLVKRSFIKEVCIINPSLDAEALELCYQSANIM